MSAFTIALLLAALLAALAYLRTYARENRSLRDRTARMEATATAEALLPEDGTGAPLYAAVARSMGYEPEQPARRRDSRGRFLGGAS